MHSRLEAFPQNHALYAGQGGMQARAAMINEIRAKHKNVLLLDAGDIFQGTPYFNLFGGKPELELMSMMGYDAATLGNHEFDNGLSGISQQLPHASFPFICSNYDFSKTILKDLTLPYRIIEKGGIRIGIFGLGIELKGLVSEKNYEKTRYLDPVAISREMVSELRSKNCHLIICLSHLGYEYSHDQISDVKLSASVDGIDLIIGGHTHTFLDEGVWVTSPEGKKVMINQVGWSGLKLGRIDCIFQRKFESKGLFSHNIPISEKSRYS